MDALRFQAPSGGVMRFQCFAPHIHTCPLIFPRQRRRDRMRRISIQRAGHLNLPVTDIPQTITRHVERDIATLSRVQVHVYRIDKHCQTWDAAAADMREQIHGTRGPVIVSMCRHLHQHFTWMRLRIGVHLAERHRRQRTGSIAEAAQYRFRRILVDMRGTLAVIVSNGNGCGICG